MNAALLDCDWIENELADAGIRVQRQPENVLVVLPDFSHSLPDSSEEWASIFKMALRDKTKSIFARGRLFFIAKTHLLPRHGESRIWKLQKSARPPGAKRTGDKYALVGQEFSFPSENTCSHFDEHLPPSLAALFYLAQIGRALVLELILDGKLDEHFTINKCRELRNHYRPDLDIKRPFNRSHWLRRLARAMNQLKSEGKRPDWLAAVPELAGHLESLRTLADGTPDQAFLTQANGEKEGNEGKAE